MAAKSKPHRLFKEYRQPYISSDKLGASIGVNGSTIRLWEESAEGLARADPTRMSHALEILIENTALRGEDLAQIVSATQLNELPGERDRLLKLGNSASKGLGTTAIDGQPDRKPASDEVLRSMYSLWAAYGFLRLLIRDKLPPQFLSAAGLLLGDTVSRPTALSRWVAGRTLDLRCWVDRALPLVQRAAPDIERDLDLGKQNELTSIILLDTADVYAVAGDLDNATYYARRAARVAEALCHEEGTKPRRDNSQWKRYNMGIARTLVLQQQIEYQRGCEAKCWELHAEAIPYLETAEDAYGFAKSYYFLALMRFHQGDLDGAEVLATLARDHALAIRPVLPYKDLLWSIRDGVFFGGAWWRIHTLVLLVDVLACKGQADSPQFIHLYAQCEKERPRWARDFPPFSPRYVWLAEWSKSDDQLQRQLERRLHQRIKNAPRSGYVIYLPDLYLSYGDFLNFRGCLGDEEAATAQYQLAAEAKGSELARVAARRRLADRHCAPVGLRGKQG